MQSRPAILTYVYIYPARYTTIYIATNTLHAAGNNTRPLVLLVIHTCTQYRVEHGALSGRLRVPSYVLVYKCTLRRRVEYLHISVHR